MGLLVSIFDKKASVYHPPLAFPNLASVMRSYASAFIKNPEASIVQFHSDYDIYQVADFDEVSGAIQPIIPPNFLESMTNIQTTANVSFARHIMRKEINNGQE